MTTGKGGESRKGKPSPLTPAGSDEEQFRGDLKKESKLFLLPSISVRNFTTKRAETFQLCLFLGAKYYVFFFYKIISYTKTGQKVNKRLSKYCSYLSSFCFFPILTSYLILNAPAELRKRKKTLNL